jgi:lipopolysaccharide/colanic/teichoic acid biosynthesis glycosyltransferase
VSLYPLKRSIDVIGGLVGLGLTGFVFVPIAVAIKVDSPGPVIFVQDRIGQNEHVFRMYKFRTMHPRASGQGPKPAPNDERVSRIGRFLRRTSLDELPQFLNILRGEMSLVGPRPEQAVFFSRYLDWQKRRFLVRPGLTGWWQVNGRKQPMHEHIDEDIYYVDHCSLRLDLLILWRTVRAVWSGQGAI